MTDNMFSSPVAHTDLAHGGWIDTKMPAWTRPYLRLARLDRPTGIWLLLLPCLWSIVLASPSLSSGAGLVILFTLGAIIMRGAGCALNDILDRDVDAQVERTRGRPIPSGEVGVAGASVFLVLQLLVGLVILLELKTTAIWLGVLSLGLVGTYPLMKRLTWWPQAFLGLTFNWGALMGWAAATGSISWTAIWLYVAGFFWTLVYDTIYAHQDARDDEIAGVKSTALRLGRFSRLWLFGFAAAMLLFLFFAGVAASMGTAYHIMLIPVAGHLVWMLAGWDIDDPRDCLARFQASRWTGLLVVLAIAVGRMFRA